jgi:cob(I)alamin adenosyltransferase
MGHRISKVYTRTGDQGETGLGDGSRVHKADPRIAAMGEVDELNCQLGVLIASIAEGEEASALLEIQHDLFDLGGELAVPGMDMIEDHHAVRLEQLIDRWNEELPPLKEFILPGGSLPAAQCHLARGICRRAERQIMLLHIEQALSSQLRCYINRLSDLLFVLARRLARVEGGHEILWDRKRFSE